MLGGCSTVPAEFHPPRTIPAGTFSHALWDQLLRAHVVDGVVNYPTLAKDKAFGEYLNLLNHADPLALPTKQDQLAFWINAYNALAAKGIVDHYSPSSAWGRIVFFVGHDYYVGGESLNLYGIEREILIPLFDEPRIHFAVVGATASCPKMQSWAYQGERLEQQLDLAARSFVNDPACNRFDREQRVAYLSMIFNWFSEDFMSRSGSLIQYIKPYLDDPTLVRELEQTPYRVEFQKYDWSLNGVPPVEE